MSSLLRTMKRRIEGTGGMGTGGGSWGRRYLEDEKDSAKFTLIQAGMHTKALKPVERHPNHPVKLCKRPTWKGRRKICTHVSIQCRNMEDNSYITGISFEVAPRR